uniref:Uncharacterized protein n=1 Tax=viral metagenome TaxID=1070528 RepID=A0A6C0BZD5_9ZZZZ
MEDFFQKLKALDRLALAPSMRCNYEQLLCPFSPDHLHVTVPGKEEQFKGSSSHYNLIDSQTSATKATSTQDAARCPSSCHSSQQGEDRLAAILLHFEQYAYHPKVRERYGIYAAEYTNR